MLAFLFSAWETSASTAPTSRDKQNTTAQNGK
jgi:hypothetical protein